MAKKNPKVSIIVPNWNGIKYTLKCLDSIKKLNYDNYEVIVVDNASTDNSVEILRKRKEKNLKIIQNKKNLGFTGGCNVGIRHAAGGFISLLNNDVIVDKNYLRELVRAIKSNPKIGIVMPKVYNKYGKKKYFFNGYGTMNLFGFPIISKKISKNIREHLDTFYVSSGLLYKKDLIEQPFDPDYFMYSEDVYLSWLLRLKGYLAKIVPSAIFYHEGWAASKEAKKQSKKFGNFLMELGERNRMMNLLLFYEPKTLAKLFLPLVFLTFCRNISNPAQIRVRLKSYFWLLKNARKIYKKRRNIQKQRKVKDGDIVKFMSYKLFWVENITKNRFFRRILGFFNWLMLLYCKMLNLKTIEDYAWKSR